MPLLVNRIHRDMDTGPPLNIHELVCEVSGKNTQEAVTRDGELLSQVSYLYM